MSKKLRTPSARALARQIVRQLSIKEGSAIMVKRGSILARQDQLEAFARAVGAAGFTNVFIIVVEDFGDVKVLDEAALNELGWYYQPEKRTQPPETQK